MLTCIALAGAFYIHAEHSVEAGVRFIHGWEFVIPVEGTVIRRNTDSSEDDYISASFFTISGSTYTLHLDHERFDENWSPADLLAECGNGR